MKILAAAVNAYGMIFSMPRPARHHHILRAMDEAGLDAIAPGPEAQGFLTSEGEFVDRYKAGRIAIDAGQIDGLSWPPDLFSEDLW